MYDRQGVADLVRAARQRAELTIEELASQTGVSTETIGSIEAAEIDPEWSLVVALVSATGSELLAHLVPRADPQLEAKGAHLVGHIEELLKLTAPEKQYPLELSTSWRYVTLGLKTLVWQTVQSAVRTHALGHAAPVLAGAARACFEHTATCLWILEDPEPRSRIFIQDGNRNARLLTATQPEVYAKRMEKWVSSFGDADPEARLPGVRDRLSGPMAGWYDQYRILSGEQHSSLDAIHKVLRTTENAVETIDRMHLGSETLGFAAMQLWFVSLVVEHDLLLPEGGEQHRTGLGYSCDPETFFALGTHINGVMMDRS